MVRVFLDADSSFHGSFRIYFTESLLAGSYNLPTHSYNTIQSPFLTLTQGTEPADYRESKNGLNKGLIASLHNDLIHSEGPECVQHMRSLFTFLENCIAI